MPQSFSAFFKGEDTHVLPSAARLWWLRPAPLIILVIVPLYLSFLTFDYEHVVQRRYLPDANYYWGLALLLVLALGAVLGAGMRDDTFVEPVDIRPTLRIPAWYTAPLLIFTVVAYALWFGPLAADPGAVAAVLSGDSTNVRDAVQTIPGVTTLTQCGAAFVVLVTIKRFTPGGAALWERVGIWIVFVLAIGRAFLWAERLAVLEVLVPWAVTSAAFYRFRSIKTARLAVLLPIFGPVLLFLAFAGTEYFRSWRFYQNYYDSIWQFASERLMSYYALAANSGIGLLEEAKDWPRYTGRFVFEWAWTMPELGDILTDAFGDVRQDFDAFLLDYGDVEYNNPSGLFPIVYDVGYFGSALYFFIVGLFVGAARSSYVRRMPFGLMFYPFCVLFILELLRFNYLAASRFVPIAGSLALALFLAHELRQRRHHPHHLSAWKKT
jgi:oligosaccharide repeat unit polymerase